MEYKMVCIDMDGTLLGKGKEISKESKKNNKRNSRKGCRNSSNYRENLQ